MDKQQLKKLAGITEKQKPATATNESIMLLRKMAGMPVLRPVQMEEQPVAESSDITKMVVKIDDTTKKALNDISTFRTISVIPKKGGTVAVVSGIAADMDEIQKRWPVLAKSLAEEAEEAEEPAAVSSKDEMIALVAKAAEGKSGAELIELITRVYDAGFDDGKQHEESEEEEESDEEESDEEESDEASGNQEDQAEE